MDPLSRLRKLCCNRVSLALCRDRVFHVAIRFSGQAHDPAWARAAKTRVLQSFLALCHNRDFHVATGFLDMLGDMGLDRGLLCRERDFWPRVANEILCCDQGQKNRFFQPIFRRKIGFRWCWKRFSGGKIVCKKIGKKLGKIADFSKNLIFSRKNPIFPEIWGKLYFKSLRGEKLKNGAKQSCIIKKTCIFGKNNSCLVH